MMHKQVFFFLVSMALIFKDLLGEEKYICRRTLHNLSKTTKTDNINNRFVEVDEICLIPKHLKLLHCSKDLIRKR